ncbi:hypothetical protein [Ilyomonas limi]|nr:hypothetical protein [Ilyomonas limi]
MFYFVFFAVVYWIDIFIRNKYHNIVVDSLKLASAIKDWMYMPGAL